MGEIRSILDSVYKVCQACGQKRTLRNFRLLPRAEFGDGLVSLSDKFANVCKGCQAHPEMKLKTNRIEALKAKMKRYRENEMKRIEKEKRRELELEVSAMKHGLK